MSPSDEQQIRDVIATWIDATAAGDLDRVLSLMSEDIVFLRPGCPPMQGRDAYAVAAKAGPKPGQFSGESDIQEITVSGDYAYCWNRLQVTVRPGEDVAAVRMSGHILSVFRRECDGRWRLFRDANLLTPDKD